MDKKTYVVADGIDWINGAKVPKNRLVELTDREAQFDLGLGRLKLSSKKKQLDPTESKADGGS